MKTISLLKEWETNLEQTQQFLITKVIEQGIVGIFIALILIFLFLVIKFLIWPMIQKEKKEDKTMLSANTEAIKILTRQMEKANEGLAKLPEIDHHLWRNFLAVKIIAGDKWDAVMDRIIREEQLRKRTEEMR